MSARSRVASPRRGSFVHALTADRKVNAESKARG
jgi:hypothetical protein